MTDGPDREWMRDASCRNHPTIGLWFPDQTHPDWAPARTICHQCPAQTDCLNHAIEHHEHQGMWGGLTPRERWRHRLGLPNRRKHTTPEPAPRTDNDLVEYVLAADASSAALARSLGVSKQTVQRIRLNPDKYRTPQ